MHLHTVGHPLKIKLLEVLNVSIPCWPGLELQTLIDLNSQTLADLSADDHALPFPP